MNCSSVYRGLCCIGVWTDLQCSVVGFVMYCELLWSVGATGVQCSVDCYAVQCWLFCNLVGTVLKCSADSSELLCFFLFLLIVLQYIFIYWFLLSFETLS